MSIRLPNGSRIYPKTIEGFEAIEKCLREKTPIVVTPVDFDGTETTTVLWHPDDPGVPIEIPEAWVPPRGPIRIPYAVIDAKRHQAEARLNASRAD